MPRPKPVFTAAAIALFERLYLAGEERDEIANALGIYIDRVKKLFKAMPPEAKLTRYGNRVARVQRAKPPVRNVPANEPTPAAWADRDSRFETPRSLTGEFFGDPRPGQSALDKRMVA